MSLYVVDASVAAKWLFPEEHSIAAERLLDPSHTLCAPALLPLEMDNLILKRLRRGMIRPAEATQIRSVLEEHTIHLVPLESLRDGAYRIAARSGASLYDFLYLTLAVLMDARMVTADSRFMRAIAPGRFARHVLWVEDIP